MKKIVKANTELFNRIKRIATTVNDLAGATQNDYEFDTVTFSETIFILERVISGLENWESDYKHYVWNQINAKGDSNGN